MVKKKILISLTENTPDEQIEAGFLQGWHEIMTGQTRPAREILDEIRKAKRKTHRLLKHSSIHNPNSGKTDGRCD